MVVHKDTDVGFVFGFPGKHFCRQRPLGAHYKKHMARLARLTHKNSTGAVTARLKQVFVLLLSAIIGILISVSVNAQHGNRLPSAKTVHEYSDPCAVLEKKRTKKPWKRRFHHTAKTRKRALAAGEKTGKGPSLIGKLPAATLVQQHIIREMVAIHMKEQPNNRPIELAPLRFYTQGDQLTVRDVNPFLIATEFGLQGKTIQIKNTATEQHGLAKNIRQLMHQMGVPAERISIIETTKSSETGLSNGPTVQLVAFQVL